MYVHVYVRTLLKIVNVRFNLCIYIYKYMNYSYVKYRIKILRRW